MRLTAAALALVLVAACAAPSAPGQPVAERSPAATPSASAVDPTPPPHRAAAPTASPTDSGAPSAAPTVALGDPGRPFDAATILSAMRDSRRPGGVPTQLQTDAVANAIADAIWTADGRAWATMSIGGSCGPEACTLEVGGRHRDSLGDDLWIFSVTPADGRVEVLAAELRSLPADVAAELDRVARDAATDARLDDLVLASVRWLPPPRTGMFVLAYRTGNEEGSCGVDITLDAAAGTVQDEAVTGC